MLHSNSTGTVAFFLNFKLNCMKKNQLVLFLFLVLSASAGWTQNRMVTGKVTDDKGAGLANVNILVKGTNLGTVSTAEGNFSLSVPVSAKTLVISALNFVQQEVAVLGKNTISVKLLSSAENLQDVVVVGYSNVKKSSLTGSVAKVSGNDIVNRPVLSMDQALTGKASGVQINTSSGLVGDNVIIRIRGAASISSGSQPLIIMDGVPLIQGNQQLLYNPANALADINPNDIESVEVLKDASAASIYGSRASGGVLLITTKKGKAGQATVNYDTYIGSSDPSKRLSVLNAPQYENIINTMRSNAGLANAAKNGDYNGDGIIDNTDWQDQVYRKGMTQNHQLSISGGAGRTTYYASAGYNDFENFIIVNRQKRSSIRLNLTTKVTDWFETGFKIQFSRTLSYGLGSGTGGVLSGVPFGPLTMYPNVPVYNADGTYYIGSGGNTVTQNTPNPVAVQQLNFDNRDTRRFIASTYGEVSLLKGLKFKSQYNVDFLSAYADQSWDPSIGDGSGLAGVGQTFTADTRIWSWFNTLNYNTKIGEHDLGILAGAEYTRNYNTQGYAFGLGMTDPLFRLINTANYANVGAANTVGGPNNGLASYFGGITYAYKGKYLASTNMRADAYSGFGINNRWGYFPSGSIAWKISQEDFWKLHFVSDMKIRASYGITGNSNIGDFPSLATFNPAQYADISALNLLNPGNTSLRWEQTAQTDIGLDATIGKNINIVFDYFKKNTKDLILDNPIPATIGFPGNTIKQNIGSIQTNGFELSVGVPVINKRDLKWNINFNGAYIKNKVISTNAIGGDIAGGQSLIRPGYNMSAFYLIRWVGVNPANGLPVFLDANNVAKQYDQSAAAANRWTKVSDGSVTTAITATDRVLDNDKTPYPTLYGGLSQSLVFRNFDLSLDMQYAFGAYVYNNTKAALVAYNTSRNKSTELLSAWTKPGDITSIPKLFWNDNQSNQVSTRFLEKGDFVRIRNIQIGYNFPKQMLDKIKISRLRVYGQIQNAYTFTGYSGIDPEANANGNVNIGLGIDNFRPALARTFTFGINLGL